MINTIVKIIVEYLLTNEMCYFHQDDVDFMSQVAADLRLPPELFWGKLVAVKLLVFDDEDLLQAMFDLNEKLNHMHPVKYDRTSTSPPTSAEATPSHHEQFLAATLNQNSHMKKTHITNLPHSLVEHDDHHDDEVKNEEDELDEKEKTKPLTSPGAYVGNKIKTK